ncbi:helix-turn-helix domain-containing protein [Aerophototrophica crusticola]|uniref:Helix-turn-helix domain-containing protein n=1 Tax=Aerophototrophica crusticola TaxID=1709002 RepID=A0A858R4K8_9PROT|nr:helix-turn-helix domain-containing protein [Rhodospirillaceae bacterium B3]
MRLFSREEVRQARPADPAKASGFTDDDIDRMIADDPDEAPDLSTLDAAGFVGMSPLPDVEALRDRLGLTQEEFARQFGLNVHLLRDWEQHRAEPDTAAATLLKVIAEDPDLVRRAVGGRR